VACALFAVNCALAVGVLQRTGERLAALASAAHGPIPAEIDALRRSARWCASADVLLANDLAALFLMSAQPGPLGAVAAVLVANAAMLTVRRLLSRRKAPAPAAVRDAA
jgi:hypothetical protein